MIRVEPETLWSQHGLLKMVNTMQRFAGRRETIILTKAEERERLNRLQELGKERRRWAEAVHEAAQHGDLRENAEYHSAKEALGLADARYADLKMELANARVLTDQEVALVARKKQVTPFSTFYLEVNEKKKWYTFRKGSAKPRAQLITPQSPIGRAIMGKTVGDYVDYSVGSKEFEVEILKVLPYSKSLK